MKPIVIATILMLSSIASADRLSMSGHWQSASGQRFFLHHQTGGRIDVWVPMSSRQVAFSPGKLRLLSKADDVLRAAMYEIDADSDETLLVYHRGRACSVTNLNFNLWGLLFRSGFRGRNMEFRGVGHVSGTMVCGQDKERWSMPYAGSWKRL